MATLWQRLWKAGGDGEERAARAAGEAPPLVGRPIFISGCNRGGTTILAVMLGHHPEVCNVGAGHAFSEGQYVWREKFPDRSRHRWAVEPWRSQMRKTAAHASPELVTFFRTRFAQAAGGKGRLLEKTPANAVRIPFIYACFPDACFVHIVRDGRDTVCSLMARKVAFRYAPLQWVGAHQTALADLECLPQERVSLVRYEELLADPRRVLAGVCERCDLTLDATIERLLAETGARELKKPASRWPQLSPRQQRYALEIIGPLQSRLGYPVE